MKAERWRRVELLYNAALERLPEERADFLSEACASDEALRLEVESLLSYETGPKTLSNRRPSISPHRQ